MGVLQEPLGVGVLQRRAWVAQHTGQQAGHSVHDHHGWNLSASEHIVADGDLITGQVLPHPLIHPLVPATDEDNPIVLGHSAGHCLGEGLALGGQKDDGDVGARVCAPFGAQDGLHCSEDGLRLHHHPTPTAIGNVVGDVVFIRGVVTDVMQSNGETPHLLRPLEDALLEDPGEDAGE